MAEALGKREISARARVPGHARRRSMSHGALLETQSTLFPEGRAAAISDQFSNVDGDGLRCGLRCGSDPRLRRHETPVSILALRRYVSTAGDLNGDGFDDVVIARHARVIVEKPFGRDHASCLTG